MDLSKFVELHQFAFDNTLDEGVTNDEVGIILWWCLRLRLPMLLKWAYSRI